MPQVKQQSLLVHLDTTKATLSWKSPTGDYDHMSIRQCKVQSDVCTEHIVTDLTSTSLELTVVPQLEYVYTMLLYQEEEVVLESGPFVKDDETPGK